MKKQSALWVAAGVVVVSAAILKLCEAQRIGSDPTASGNEAAANLSVQSDSKQDAVPVARQPGEGAPVLPATELTETAKLASAEERSASTSEAITYAFSQGWLDVWFKNRCTPSIVVRQDCKDVQTIAHTIATNSDGSDDPWAAEANLELSKEAEIARAARPGAAYKVRCGSVGCILVFATPDGRPLPDSRDFPSFKGFFSMTNADIYYTGCSGCYDANSRVYVVVRETN